MQRFGSNITPSNQEKACINYAGSSLLRKKLLWSTNERKTDQQHFIAFLWKIEVQLISTCNVIFFLETAWHLVFLETAYIWGLVSSVYFFLYSLKCLITFKNTKSYVQSEKNQRTSEVKKIRKPKIDQYTKRVQTAYDFIPTCSKSTGV